jgi:hypothetical protein
MKGLIRKAAAALCCLAGAGGLGCVTYHDCVDPCYPERYNAEARREVVAAYSPQIANGHVLDQTVWNSDFEQGTDKLTGGGMEHLAYIARRRPQPDPVVYLQTAGDLYYDGNKPDEMADKRQDLDSRRVAAIQKFLGAQTGGRRGDFQVLIHDPADVGASDVWDGAVYTQMISRARGGLPVGGTSTSVAPSH